MGRADSHWKDWAWAAALLIVGAGFLVWGIAELRDTAVTCGGVVMHEGDKCIVNGDPVDYRGRHQSDRIVPWFIIGWGVFFLAGSGAFIYSAIEKLR